MTKTNKLIKGVTKKRKKDFPLATNNYIPKYNLLISNGITYEHVDKVASEVEQGLTIQTACVTTGIEYWAFYRLLNNSDSILGKYTSTAMCIAQSKFEEKLTKALLDPQQFNNKHLDAIKEMLSIVSPRFSRQLKIAYKYDLKILFDIIKKHVDEPTLLEILNEIRTTDSHAILAEYDSLLLDNDK